MAANSVVGKGRVYIERWPDSHGIGYVYGNDFEEVFEQKLSKRFGKGSTWEIRWNEEAHCHTVEIRPSLAKYGSLVIFKFVVDTDRPFNG